MGVTMLGGCAVDESLRSVDASTVLLVLENDLYRRADAALVDAALARARCVVVIDHHLNATGEKAHMLLPAASFAEGDGTLVSSEGRAQRFFQVYDPAYFNLATQVRESWRWIAGLMSTSTRHPAAWDTMDEITAACAGAVPALAGIVDAAPDARLRIKGRKIARQPPRYSGRTAMRADISVHEPRASQDPDTALTFSMEGYGGPDEPGSLIPFAWAPGWNSPQAWNKFQDEVGGRLRAGDSGVRLIEPSGARGYAAAAAPRDGMSIAVLAHIFGSEELSARAPVMESQLPGAYVALNPADAAAQGLAEGGVARVLAGDVTIEAPLRISATLAPGTIGIPAGVPGLPFVPVGAGAILGGGAK
jgi:NADH-quinone oxidoreductase subunit G